MNAELRSLFYFLLFSVVIVSSPTLQASEFRPAATVAQTCYKAPETVEGSDIVHDFVIQNLGEAPLNIQKGKTACGCIVTSVPGPIPPGGEGVATVTLSTYGSGGTTVKKTVTIVTDDPENRQIPLTIKAKVLEPYSLRPANVKLKGNVGKSIKKTLNLAPTDDNPFTIQEITAKRGQNIRFDLKEIKKRDTVRYQLIVENTSETPGIYFDTLYVKTDSDMKPVIAINVIGKIKGSI